MAIKYLNAKRIRGSSTSASGRVGTGNGQFDGSDNLNFTGNGDMDGDFTVAFWFYRSQASSAYLTAYNQMSSGGASSERIQIGTQASGAWEIYASSKVLDGNTPAQNTWYHLALTGSGTTWKWYEDGVEVDSTSSGTTATRDNDGLVTIMGEASGAFAEGYMDEFCQYDRALSAAELLSLADGSKKPNDATLDTSNSLVLYLPMDTVSSGNWYDDTSGTSQAISTTGNPAQITTIPQDEKVEITNVPAGTRYEETDTRKIFRRKDEGYTASIGTDADWTTSTDMASNSSVTSPTGLGAKSWYSNGSSSVIQMDTAGRESLFPVGADFSMSIWLYFSSIASETTAQNAPIMFPTDGSGVRWENAWRGSGSNFGRMVMDLNDGSNSSNTDANGYTAHGMSNNTWYLWVYTFDASNGTGTLYKGEYGSGNDSNVSQYTTSGTTSCTGAPNDPNYKMIGVSSEVLGGDGNARVNDVAIWNKVLSSTEMHEMFNSASSTAGGTAKKAPDVNKTAIRAYWDCQTHTATISNAATKADWVEKGTA